MGEQNTGWKRQATDDSAVARHSGCTAQLARMHLNECPKSENQWSAYASSLASVPSSGRSPEPFRDDKNAG